MTSVVRPGFGPTLPELLGVRPRALRRPALAIGAALVAAGAWLGLWGDGAEHAVVGGPAPFNLTYEGFDRVRRPGALLALERRRGRRVVETLTVRALTLPAYAGAASGVLPLA
ncbi:MAG: hypothetical protein M3P39_09145, partial [Actinomycetota bacterium]|nr:hypothetical protein [Actinomycetota bacterium]